MIMHEMKSQFDKFWKLYPKKRNKKETEELFYKSESGRTKTR